MAETKDGGKLREAARRNSDESILVNIADKDCVALEVRYHRRCYERYTSFLRRSNVIDEVYDSENYDRYACKYEKSFDVFCERFVKKRLLMNEEIFFMKRMKAEFVKTVSEIEGTDASNYRNFRLKERLRERFPQIVFFSPKERNKSEIVYVEGLCQGTVAENYLNEDTETSQSEMDTEDEFFNNDVPKGSCNKTTTLNEVFNVALTLRGNLRASTKSIWYENWPPLASDINNESVRKIVSPTLFNFLAWMLGFSDDPDLSEYVEVGEKNAIKLYSLCQDLINVSSKGKMQTPKSLALATAVRQISGCSSLISLLNGLGHCVSLSSAMAYDSALAQTTIDTSNIVPKEFVEKEYVNLIYDNIDFGEDIKKQTHVTNGIITQKLSGQQHITMQNSSIVKKSQRTVKMPNTNIAEYSIGAKKTPIFFDINEVARSMLIDRNHELNEAAHKLDLAYVLTKMVHVTDETALPGWTGFNTMLIEEIPEVSRVGYLPVINAPPTEYSTINEILKRSKNIAEKLDLQYAVLVFDEAVYSKVQHIRWKEPVYYDKLVVRLGEFHTVMSFLSAVSKLFEDGGLKVRIHILIFTYKTCTRNKWQLDKYVSKSNDSAKRSLGSVN